MNGSDSHADATRTDPAHGTAVRSVRGEAQRKRARTILGLLAITSPIWMGAWLFGLAMFMTLVVPNIVQRHFQPASTRVKVDIAGIESAAREYAINNGARWPSDLDVLVRPDVNGESYLDAATVPLDPWGRAYLYEPPRPGQSVARIYTLGRDGVPGGEHENADIDNRSSRR